MVVVSGNWVRNVPSYPALIPCTDALNADTKMTAKAILICRPNSHPFQERTLTLELPVKIGRSVARSKATATNAIFDCKVLSRHHAILWYENGKFYLQDTKSSNGTFVNNNRLEPETEHHEVCSGDIVQFGVDVLENNRKVTHGCIIATLKLYLPDGTEAKASASIGDSGKCGMVPLDELYKLHQVIQEASQREQCLDSKLIALQSAVQEAQKSADNSWQAYVGEERLLSRISALENRLQQANNRNWGDEKCNEELHKLQEEIMQYQTASKTALEKLHNERLDAINRASDQERLKMSAELEITTLKEQLNETRKELDEVAQKLYNERMRFEQQQKELQSRLEGEQEKIKELQLDMYSKKNFYDGENICNDDLKAKEELLQKEENDYEKNTEEPEQNHINLVVKPVDEQKSDDSIEESLSLDEEIIEKHVTFNLNGNESPQILNESQDVNEKEDVDLNDDDTIDSKTLKYKYQSAQNELKKQIEVFMNVIDANTEKINELEMQLKEQKEIYENLLVEKMKLETELDEYRNKCDENQKEMEELKMTLNETNGRNVSLKEFMALEEEIILLKENHSRMNEENLKLKCDVTKFKRQYETECNRSMNNVFFAILPFIILIIYYMFNTVFS